MNAIIEEVNKQHEKESVSDFEIGDTVDVHFRIVEGEKERIQVFTGQVIARRGTGVNSYFTVRRIVGEMGVERIFPVHSPRVEKVEVARRGRAKRSKLYYLRQRVGKSAVLREESRESRLKRPGVARQVSGSRKKKKKRK